MKSIIEAVIQLGQELHPDRAAALASAFKQLNSYEEFLNRKNQLCSGLNIKFVNQLANNWSNYPQITPSEISIAIETASEIAYKNMKRHQDELVWTGPSTGIIPTRRTEQAMIEVIKSAKKKLFIVSFVAYEVEPVIVELKNAIIRNVEVSILLELTIEDGGKVTTDSIRRMKKLIPELNIYSWEASNDTTHHGSVHAKCAVADYQIAFITSANLTYAAMEKNIELGVLIKGGDLPKDLHNHLEALIITKAISLVK